MYTRRYDYGPTSSGHALLDAYGLLDISIQRHKFMQLLVACIMIICIYDKHTYLAILITFVSDSWFYKYMLQPLLIGLFRCASTLLQLNSCLTSEPKARTVVILSHHHACKKSLTIYSLSSSLMR